MPPTRAPLRCLQELSKLPTLPHRRPYSTPPPSPSPPTSPFAPRHLLSIADLTTAELTTLILNAHTHKQTLKSGLQLRHSLSTSLSGKTVAMTFNKRSTRTRVSTEGAVAALGGHPMFLGKDDIQLGVNESLYDTSVVISSMVSAWFARVGPHSDVAEIAKNSSVPVINALSDDFHPLQAIADFLTIHEVFHADRMGEGARNKGLGLEGLKIAWVGDANNVLYDLALASLKLGVHISIATPSTHSIPPTVLSLLHSTTNQIPTPGTLTTTHNPLEAVHAADILVTDTWVSMGQEHEKAARLAAFQGFQITKELAERGGAKEGWRFMHCLPRKKEEVSDEVFYDQGRSLVWREAENRLWAAMAVLEGFVVNKGKIEGSGGG